MKGHYRRNPVLLELRYVPLSDANLYEKNAKKHDLGDIQASIRRNGFKSAPKWEPVLNGGNGGIVDGNGRIEALVEMQENGEDPPEGIAESSTGEWCVPVLFGVDCANEIQAAAYALDANNLVVKGGEGFSPVDLAKMYDIDLYLEQLKLLAEEDYLPISVFADDLALLLKEREGGEELEEEDSEGEGSETEPPKPRCELNQIWQLGRHRLLCGSCLDEPLIDRLIGKTKIDMVHADPPYGIAIVQNQSIGGSKGMGSVGGSKVVKVNAYEPIAGDDAIDTAVLAAQLCLEKFSDARQIWWGANYYAHVLPPSSCWVVWDKQNTGNFADAELAWTNSPTAVRIFVHLWNGMIRASEHEKRVHPTQKPKALFKWLAENYGHEGDIIFDPFLGSGMSLLAAEEMGEDRAVLGCELSLHYCETIMLRWEKLTGEQCHLAFEA